MMTTEPKDNRSPGEAAMRYGGLLLGRQAYGTEEMRRKMSAKGFEEPDIEFAVTRLTELGYLDDESYARAVAARLSRRYYGELHIRRELLHRGIDRDTVEETLEDLPSAEESIKAFLRKNAGKTEKQAIGALQRRGFLWEDISAVMEEEE